jgi:hypothetical protein
MKDKLELLKEKQSQISNLKNDVIDLSSGIFEDFYRYIFEKYPTLESFGWTQYTPYFNDGDVAIFSVNTDWIYINGIPVDDSDWVNETTIINYGTWNREKKVYEGRTEVPNLNYDKELSKASDEISEFLSNFDNEFFMSQFGDHAEITVTSEGVSVDEYEHD